MTGKDADGGIEQSDDGNRVVKIASRVSEVNLETKPSA